MNRMNRTQRVSYVFGIILGVVLIGLAVALIVGGLAWAVTAVWSALIGG